jgi:hypothetical protein
MSFTRKHYTEVARIIREQFEYLGTSGTDTAEARSAVARVAIGLRSMFASDNPRFDAERFAKACEPGGGK